MEIPPGAATAGFAATNVSHGEGTAEKTSTVDDLCQAGTALPFAIRDLGALQVASGVLRTKVYKNLGLSRAETRMRICYQAFRKE